MNPGYDAADLDLHLWDNGCNTEIDSSTTSSSTAIESVSERADASGMRPVEVRHASGGSGMYDLTGFLSHDDAGSGGDAVDAPTCSTSISEGSHTGTLASLAAVDTNDCYTIQMPILSRLTVTVDGEDHWLNGCSVELYKGDGVTQVASSTSACDGSSDDATATCHALTGGPVKIRVVQDDGTGGYQLTVLVEEDVISTSNLCSP